MLGDMGLAGQYDHPRVRENLPDRDRCLPQARQALRRRRAREPSRPDGGICPDGARYVSTGTDLAFLLGAATSRAKQIKDIKL